VRPVDRRAGLQRVDGGVHGLDLVGEALVDPGGLAALLGLLLERLEVGVDQLDLERGELLDGVGRARHVDVDEGPQHEHDGVDLADVGEEAVAQALALRRALDQTGDVDELHAGGDDRGLAHLGQQLSRSSGTLATPTLGSTVAKAYGAASAPPPASAL
jgi:hypothetical protein